MAQLNPALGPHFEGRAPGKSLLESCPWSTRLRYMKTKHQPVRGLPSTLLRGSYKSCQHGLPQAFSFSNTQGVQHCFSSSPPPSIFLEKTFCVTTVFTDILASWPFCCARTSLPPRHSKWPLFRPTAHNVCFQTTWPTGFSKSGSGTK